MATDLVTRTGKAAALSAADHDQNIESVSGTVTAKVNDYTVLFTDQNQTIEFTKATSVTCTLDAIATIVAAIDTTSFRVTIKNLGAGLCTIDGNGAETIDGATTYDLAQYESVEIQIDAAGTGWNSIGNRPQRSIHVNNSTGGCNVSEVELDLDALTPSTWIDVGPTGAGATNTWTGLDGVPLDANWVEIKIQWSYTKSLSSAMQVSILARKNGTTPTSNESRIVLHTGTNADASGTARSDGVSFVKVPLDTANIFEINVATTASPTTSAAFAMVAGYGWN